jgi:hypothetical protein
MGNPYARLYAALLLFRALRLVKQAAMVFVLIEVFDAIVVRRYFFLGASAESR